MPRKKPSITTPEEVIIGYFVTKPLDRVQETLSHVQTIVRSRTMHMTARDSSASTEVASSSATEGKAPRPARAAKARKPAAIDRSGETSGAGQTAGAPVEEAREFSTV